MTGHHAGRFSNPTTACRRPQAARAGPVEADSGPQRVEDPEAVRPDRDRRQDPDTLAASGDESMALERLPREEARSTTPVMHSCRQSMTARIRAAKSCSHSRAASSDLSSSSTQLASTATRVRKVPGSRSGSASTASRSSTSRRTASGRTRLCDARPHSLPPGRRHPPQRLSRVCGHVPGAAQGPVHAGRLRAFDVLVPPTRGRSPW